jgi:hypothetical protein
VGDESKHRSEDSKQIRKYLNQRGEDPEQRDKI